MDPIRRARGWDLLPEVTVDRMARVPPNPLLDIVKLAFLVGLVFAHLRVARSGLQV